MTSPSRRVRKLVLPAAGLGTRFLPATKALPKEMLPIVDKPIIQYAIEEGVLSGIEQVIIVTGRGKTVMEDHFDLSYELEKTLEGRGKQDLLEEARSVSRLAKIATVRQKEPLGLGHAVLMARDLVGDEPFAVALCDDVIDAATPVLKQMTDVFEETGDPVIALLQVPREQTSSYGVISGEPAKEAGDARLWSLRDMVEKPRVEEAPSDLAIIGRYILTPDIFAELEATASDRTGEIQLTNGLRSLMRKRPVFGYRFEGRRYDAGSKAGFLEATVDYALKRADVGPILRAHLKTRAE
jgi:UTP--glucose-1-phosphate uridylyltransferase